MALDTEESGPIVLPPNSKNNLVLGVQAWDFVNVDPADDNVIVEVGCVDGKAEFRVLGSIGEENYPGSGLTSNGEWGVIHGETRLTLSQDEVRSDTYTKHPFMVVVADNPTPNPVTVFAIMYGRNSLGDPASIPVGVTGSWSNSVTGNTNTITVNGIDVEEECQYFAAAAIDDSNDLTAPTGMGLTWTSVNQDFINNNIRLRVWKGVGTPSGAGTVTFQTATGNVSWAVNVCCVKRVNKPGAVIDTKKGNGSSTLPLTSQPCNTEVNSTFLAYTAFASNSVYTATDGTASLATPSASNQIRLRVRYLTPTTGTPREVAGELSVSAPWVVIGIGIDRA